MKCRRCDSPLQRRQHSGLYCPVCRTIKPPHAHPAAPVPFVVYSDPPRRRKTTNRQLVRLAKRDGGWICHLCGGPIDPRLGPDDPLAPTRDHLIPRSAGGPNTTPNLKLAHKQCNEQRGARPLDTLTG